MATPDPDLPFDLTGCTVRALEWPRRGLRFVLGGKAADGRAVDGLRLTFEELGNPVPVRTFLTARLRCSPPRGGRPPEYHVDPSPVRLPARLTCFRRSRAAKASYGDPVYANYYGAPRVGPGERLYLFALGVPRFRDRPPFPVVCGRVALVYSGGAALGGAETLVPPPLTVALLEDLGRRFATAVLKGDEAAAHQLLTPAARRRLGKTGLDRLLPRGVSRATASVFLEHLTVNAEPGGEAADTELFAQLAPDVPPNSVRGCVTVYAGDPDWDIDPMCHLYVTGEGNDARIAHAEPN